MRKDVPGHTCTNLMHAHASIFIQVWLKIHREGEGLGWMAWNPATPFHVCMSHVACCSSCVREIDALAVRNLCTCCARIRVCAPIDGELRMGWWRPETVRPPSFPCASTRKICKNGRVFAPATSHAIRQRPRRSPPSWGHVALPDGMWRWRTARVLPDGTWRCRMACGGGGWHAVVMGGIWHWWVVGFSGWVDKPKRVAPGVARWHVVLVGG